ncbi:glycerol uptake protein, partial [Strigomonas culicis]
MMSFNAFASYLHTPHLAAVQLDLRCRRWLWRALRGPGAAPDAAPPGGGAYRYVREGALYLVRIALLLFCVLLLLHTAFVTATARQAHYLSLQRPTTQAAALCAYLAHLWLKFALIWRVARFFSLYLYGIDPPEDMRRCFVNTVTIRDFWRDWHASFNLWIVRYMYIPMGGSRHQRLSIFPIFFFIAIWHDHALHLLHWALAIALAFLVEMAVTTSFTQQLQHPVAAALVL